ncbi:MAG: shikimate dehydrogenase [Flavobacteriaceae bacterium]|nr:shikimate dehydrogenase [Flavobacteriaceae bacterium]
MEVKKQFGLIGKNIDYSFSRNYFTEKFKKLGIEDKEYVNFDMADISEFQKLDLTNVAGLNVTIPYKKQIIPFLDSVDAEAMEVGAVNTIKIVEGKLVGYNTDIYGFQKSIEPLLQKHHKKALILGTGGASQAVSYVFRKLKIPYLFVSRQPNEKIIGYEQLNQQLFEEYQIIVNCTPLGTFPAIEKHPNIPYEYLTISHLLYDLIYNPAETSFLKKGKEKGAITKNGYKMLVFQAEKSWKIWNK